MVHQTLKERVSKKFNSVERQLWSKKRFITGYDEVKSTQTFEKEENIRDDLSENNEVKTATISSSEQKDYSLSKSKNTLKEQLMNKVSKMGENLHRAKNGLAGYKSVDNIDTINDADINNESRDSQEKEDVLDEELHKPADIEFDESGNPVIPVTNNSNKRKSFNLHTLSTDLRNYCNGTYISIRDFIQNRDEQKSTKKKLLEENMD